MKLLLICLITVLLAIQTTAEPLLVNAPQIFKTWTIAFVRNHNIYTAKADGTHIKFIVKDAGAPCWSPDKRILAYYSLGNIWIIGADGRGKWQLTHYGKQHRCKPDEIRISWNHKTNGITFSHPYFLKAANLTGGSDDSIYGASIYDLYPVITGKPIISVRFDIKDGGTSYCFVNNENPTWSRDGETLAFTRNGDIWIAEYVPEEGGGRAGWDIRRIAAVAEYDSPTYRCSRENRGVTHLSWSPDGEYLSYCRNRLNGSGSYDMHILKPKNGTFEWDDTEILNDGVFTPSNCGFQPTFDCFSPDSKWIAFSSDCSTWAIFLDGKQLVKVIQNAEHAVW